jgi:predicted nucleic acid-binding protein
MAKRRHKPRVMVDASIIFAAVGWKRWPYYVLKHAAAGDFQLVLCEQIIDEVMEEIAAKLPDRASQFRRLLPSLKPEISPEPTTKQITRNKGLLPDPEDVPIALAAINARVDYFVSEDKHFTQKSARTARLHQRLNIMLSGTFLREVMKWTSEQLEEVRARER